MSDSATPNVRPSGDQPRGHGDLHGLVVDAEDDVAQARLDGPAHLDLLLVEHGRDVVERAGACGDAHLDALDTRGQKGERDIAGRIEGVDAVLQGSARPDSLAPQVRRTRLAMTPSSPASAMRAREVGQDGPLEHLDHLVGDARDGVDDLVADRADEAGCRADLLGDDGGALGDVGLALVVGRHGAAAGLEEAADAVDDLLVADELDAHHLGDGLAGDVVLGGAETAAHDDAVAAGECGPQGQRDALVVVAHRLVELGRHTVGRQAVTQPGGVGVGDLPEQQLGADRHDFDPHGADLRGWCAAPVDRRAGTRPR